MQDHWKLVAVVCVVALFVVVRLLCSCYGNGGHMQSFCTQVVMVAIVVGVCVEDEKNTCA